MLSRAQECREEEGSQQAGREENHLAGTEAHNSLTVALMRCIFLSLFQMTKLKFREKQI